MKTFDDAVHELADEMAELIIRKQSDYGSSNIMRSVVEPELAILVRLNDKLARLGNLIQKGKEAQNEPLEDSWKDVVGYGLIALMVKRGTFTLPLKDE